MPGEVRSGLRIRVRFYNIVADQVGGRAEERWVPDGSVIADLLRDLAAQHPALSRYAARAIALFQIRSDCFATGASFSTPASRWPTGMRFASFPSSPAVSLSNSGKRP